MEKISKEPLYRLFADVEDPIRFGTVGSDLIFTGGRSEGNLWTVDQLDGLGFMPQV